MKTKDLEIFIETALYNVKRNKWTIEYAKKFIFDNINLLFQEFNNKLKEVD